MKNYNLKTGFEKKIKTIIRPFFHVHENIAVIFQIEKKIKSTNKYQEKYENYIGMHSN